MENNAQDYPKRSHFCVGVKKKIAKTGIGIIRLTSVKGQEYKHEQDK